MLLSCCWGAERFSSASSARYVSLELLELELLELELLELELLELELPEPLELSELLHT